MTWRVPIPPTADIIRMSAGADVALRKINVFALGDSTNVNTWSNLPFYLCAALEQRATLRRINLLPPKPAIAYSALRRVARPLWQSFAASHEDAFRNRLRSSLINKRIAMTSRVCKDADLDLFLTFSFSSYGTSRAPVVHYCDRTYEHYLEENGIRPALKDRYFIEQEKQNLRNAFCVFVTNELCREFIRERYGINNVILVPAGINVETTSVFDPDSLIKEKLRSKDVVFIAREAYRRGVDIAVDAFRLAAQGKKEWRLHIVGVRPEEVRADDERIKVYGYLRKDLPADRVVYDDLYRRARVFVCPVRKGQPPTGAIREAQLMCSAVVLSDVSDGPELVRHGYNGLLTDSLKPEAFAHYMTQLVENDVMWSKLALAAHQSIRERTWDKTVSELIETLSSIKPRDVHPRIRHVALRTP
jgi:glycosyltransferase involved in cell wall biosynthesis